MGLSGEGLLAFEWTLIGVTIVLIAARLHLRLNYIGVGFVMSDWFVLATLICNMTLSAADTYLYTRGTWKDNIEYYVVDWVLSEHYELIVLKIFYASVFPWYLSQYLNKGILITLYFDVFGRQSGKIRNSLYILLFYTVSAFITTVCVNLFSCKFGCHWTINYLCPSSCLLIQDNVAFALHFTNDLWIFIFPLVLISQLQMSKAQKISASITFCLGIINIGVTFTRWFINQVPAGLEPDITTAEALFIADSHSALIIAILPSLRPYLRILKMEDTWARHSKSRSDGTGTIRKETVISQQISRVSREESVYNNWDSQYPEEGRHSSIYSAGALTQPQRA